MQFQFFVLKKCKCSAVLLSFAHIFFLCCMFYTAYTLELFLRCKHADFRTRNAPKSAQIWHFHCRPAESRRKAGGLLFPTRRFTATGSADRAGICGIFSRYFSGGLLIIRLLLLGRLLCPFYPPLRYFWDLRSVSFKFEILAFSIPGCSELCGSFSHPSSVTAY